MLRTAFLRALCTSCSRMHSDVSRLHAPGYGLAMCFMHLLHSDLASVYMPHIMALHLALYIFYFCMHSDFTTIYMLHATALQCA